MQQLLDSKLTYVFVGCLLAVVSYFLVGRDSKITENEKNGIIAAHTLINISHQLGDVVKNQDAQTEAIKENTQSYISLDKKVSRICDNQKQYWNVHGCNEE